MNNSSPWSRALARMMHDPSAIFGIAIIIVLLLSAILSAQFAHPYVQDLAERLSAPGSPDYLLGSDHFGRDILSRLAAGAQVSLRVGILASTISLLIGTILGTIAGYFGGKLDTLIMRLTDIVMGFPVLLFLIAISAVFQPGINTCMLAIGCVTWPQMARLMRGQILSLKSQEFLTAAIALGYSHPAIILRHILPNCLAPVIVTLTLGISGAIMAEASLSFLGLGVQPPTPSWGAMINEGKDFLRVAPWLSLLPGLAIAATVLAFNLLGEALRDALDVKAN